MIATPMLLQRHRGVIKCKGCGQPIREGEDIIRRRVSNRVRWFHRGCIYTEAKQVEEAEASR